MADRTEISWTDSTFNPWIGCTKVGPGCDACYAEAMDKHRRWGGALHWGSGVPRFRTAAATWKKPLQWNKEPWFECPDCGLRGDGTRVRFGAGDKCPHHNAKPARRRVFCASLADVFDNEVDPAWRADLFALIQATPNLDWLLLTKRVGRVLPMVEHAADHHFDHGDRNVTGWLTDWYKHGIPPRNVWLGATVVNQEEADRDVQKLLAIPARVRFLSVEPMLGPVDLRQAHIAGERLPRVDWVIAGGESGHNARPMNPDWARALRDQCQAAGVSYFFKQWGEYVGEDDFDRLPLMEPQLADPQDYFREHRWDSLGRSCSYRVGTKKAGHLLDGRTWHQFPEAHHA